MSKATKVKKSLPIPHYVCMGCRFVSDKLEKCQTNGCPRRRNPLGICNCKDGKHAKIPKLDAGGKKI